MCIIIMLIQTGVNFHYFSSSVLLVTIGFSVLNPYITMTTTII